MVKYRISARLRPPLIWLKRMGAISAKTPLPWNEMDPGFRAKWALINTQITKIQPVVSEVVTRNWYRNRVLTELKRIGIGEHSEKKIIKY